MDVHSTTTGLVIFIIIVALVFDYTNGFHDAANAIAPKTPASRTYN